MTTLEDFDADFDGPTYKRSCDHERLAGNLRAVYQMLSDEEWHRLDELREVGGSAADARVRDLRKPKFGGHVIESKRDGDGGGWLYRMIRE